MDGNKELGVAQTHIFKANAVVGQQDIWLRFQIRALLSRAEGVDVEDKIAILRDEARILEKDTLGLFR